MFWGLVLEPEKRYSQIVRQPFHVSHACLDLSTGDGQVCQVLLRTTGGNFIICSLQKGKDVQCPLDLYFKAGSDITFSTNGKCQVHLTGYIDPVDLEGLEEEEEEELDETALSDEDLVDIKLDSKKKEKRKLNTSAEQSTNKKAKKDQQNGVDKKPSKIGTGDSDSDDSSDDEVDLQDLLEGEDVDSDEQDNSYRPDDVAKAGAGVSDEEEDDDSDEDEDDDDDDDEDDEEEEESETEQPTKQQQKKNKQEIKPQLNGIEKKKTNENKQQQKKEKNKEAKKQQKEKPQQPQREKKTITGGVHIEDMKVGSGPEITSGKSVQVYYEGRLKSNNKMFDKHLNGPGFKFRVGGQEVIKGWDVGILGMRVGGKRKIICPPNMAYGPKGSPPVIPPNSTLVFEVEVKNAN